MSYLADIERSVVPYDPSNKTALREFQRAYFGPTSRQCDDRFAEWLFEQNPHRDPNEPTLWLCKRDGVVVGQQASIPVRLKVGELQYRAAWVIDLMVHPDWRLKGVAPALFAAYAKSTEVMLGLGLEDLAYRTFRRAGWKDIGTLSLFVRPLDPQACAKGLNAPKLLTKLAPRVLVGGSAQIIGRVAGGFSRVSLEAIPAFDERVDRVWAVASRDYDIVLKRDFASLRWRFDEIPYRACYERYYFARKGKIVGYVVIRMDAWYGRTVGRVIDYFTERQSLAVCLALIIAELHAKGTAAVFFEQLHAGSVNVLRALGCLRVRTSERFMFNLRDRSAPLAGTLNQADRWFVTPGDSDLDQIAIGLRTTVDHATC